MTTNAQKQKRALTQFMDSALDLQSNFLIWNMRGALPPEWDEIDINAPVPPKKEKISIRMDADVIKYFRALGPHYTTQINAVLRCFVMGRLANTLHIREEGLSIDELMNGYRQKTIAELEMEARMKARREGGEN
ncbi:hypothetical protein GCM10008927_15180 [Amylibacter ulvae]|uniref:BrnA antitoxin of type II toxin-antitoxin system n=1 Tax=Paramylibacter ulvae TaxID=1651968 RepID=A0ABQ3CZ76_9RHOB|nr:BrnA antitoxin family protein [Amylibacter ulvae]GHA50883.1 hypothetical protein GCM10008927_15180 [Amylibacter ulvae]